MFDRVLFIGSKASGYRVLRIMHELSTGKLVGCVTCDDSDDVRSELDTISSYCGSHGIPLDILKGKCDLAEPVRKYKPDLCIVMGWYHIIPEELINEVKGGFIGIHNSLLPAHRGFAPVVWTMIAGEKKAGFSVFSFDKGMDTGDIWFQQEVPISDDDYISDVLERLEEKTEDFFREHYTEMLEGKLRPHEQSAEGTSYGAMRTPEDGIIDWSRDSETVRNFIRAQSHPYPGAYTFLKGEKITIWHADLFPYPIQGSPGQIGMFDPEDGSAVIICGNSTGLKIKGLTAKSLKDRLG